MRTILFSALCAAGIALASATGAAAAPLAPASYDAVPGVTLITPAQMVIIAPPRRHRVRVRVCRPVRQCYRGRYGRLVCRTRTVCTWRYR